MFQQNQFRVLECQQGQHDDQTPQPPLPLFIQYGAVHATPETTRRAGRYSMFQDA